MSYKIVILGAGPAGLSLAMKLLRRHDNNIDVTVIEQERYVGGLTASFEYEGLHFDYGSHRLHPATRPDILNDLRSLLGPELLVRRRNGRIRLLGRFVKFPLNPLDLALHLPPSFVMAVARDTIAKMFRAKNESPVSFADALLNGLGKTICKNFYFPYARKLWGLEPEEISALQAQKRVSADSLSKIVLKVLALVPGLKREGAGCFYYPSREFGQISQALAREVKSLGGKILLSTRIKEIDLKNGRPMRLLVNQSDASQAAGETGIPADFVFSTIPVTTLMEYLKPQPPADVKTRCNQLQYRNMVFCYLVLKADRFTPYDAHYFPEQDTIFSRISEPRNYGGPQEPNGLTGLCAEIPCSFGDDIWIASDDEISGRVMKDMAHVGLAVQCPVKAGFVRRARHVYPVYDLDFESRFDAVDNYLNGISGIVSLGRQALFAHDNTHHTIEMAYEAAECLKPGPVWDSETWKLHRKKFNEHVVED